MQAPKAKVLIAYHRHRLSMRASRIFRAMPAIVLLLFLAVSTSEVADAATFEELFLQPDNFEKSYWDTSYMDVVQPTGSMVKSATSRSFVTRALAGSSTFTRFALRLWVSAYTQDYIVTVAVGVRVHNASSSFMPIFGIEYAGQRCEATGCRVTVPAGAQTVDAEIDAPGSGFSTFAGKRLELRLSSSRTFYWGDSSHQSSLTTDRIDLEGIPIPELPQTALLLCMALLVASVILAARKGLRSSEAFGACR